MSTAMQRLIGSLAITGLVLLVVALVIPPPGSEARPQQGAYGRALFAAKGCAMCHAHAAIPRSGEFAGAYGAEAAPDLSSRRLDAEYLRHWLRDPAAVRPGTSMPNLNLSENEIEALVAFLQEDPRKGDALP
jgi:cytochrome c1